MKIKLFLLSFILFILLGCSNSVDEPKSYTITFIANNDNAIGDMKKITAEENSTIQIKKNNFTCEGYEFVNWNTKSDGTGTKYDDCSSIKMTEDLNLYAQWKLLPKKFTVTFYPNKENYSGTMENIIADENSNITIPENNFTCERYKFINWNTESNGTGYVYETNSTLKLTNNIKLYAQWRIKENIEVSLNTNLPTNQDVIISVEIQNLQVTEIGYVYAINKINWNNPIDIAAVSSYTTITNPVNNVYKITSSNNGYFSILIKDSENNYYVKEITVSNIDRIAPNGITNLISSYNKVNDEINVTWNNPNDTDLDFINLSYTKNGNVIIRNIHVTNEYYTISDIAPDEASYTFQLYAVDKAGNTSIVSSTTVIPPLEIIVKSINLDRYHVLRSDVNQTINVTATLDNLHLLDDNTPVKIQIKDSSGSLTTKTASVDKVLGKAEAAITIPSTSEVTYTVMCKIGDESADTKHTARFTVSGSATLKSIQQTTNSSRIEVRTAANGLNEIIRIKGNNLDLINPSIQIYNSKGQAFFTEPITVDTSSLKWTATTGEIEQTVETMITLPKKEGNYIIVILFNGIMQKNCTIPLTVYDASPKITDVLIPIVDVSKEDNLFTVKIKVNTEYRGNYTLSYFNAICTEKPSIVADATFEKRDYSSTIYANFTVPGSVGEYDITINYGSSAITKKLIVKDYSEYSVGDVFLIDGSVIHNNLQNLRFTSEQKSNAIAVLAYFNEYGAPVGVSTKYGYQLEWAKSDTIACQSYISSIVYSDLANPKYYDDDGSDNWHWICINDIFATIEPEKYPAFYWANTFATTYNLSEEIKDGWYIPTMPELSKVNSNSVTIKNVFNALGVSDFTGGWSSNQYDYQGWYTYAWAYGGEREKNSKTQVRCIKIFK